MSINNKRSYTEYTVTQPTTDFAIGFDDFDEGGKDNILVTLNGVLVESLGYADIRKNESTVTITPAITEGTVRLTRETDIDEPFHKFTAGALFSAKSMDENFQQVRHSQQEVRDGFVFLEYNTNGIVQESKVATAQAKAATVEATASAVRAETAADTAVQAVGSLQGVVNAATTATTNANTATAIATTAASQATAATTSAQNAALAATVAKQEAATATANAKAATVDTLAATGRANDAADVVADLVVGKVRAQDVSTVDGSTVQNNLNALKVHSISDMLTLPEYPNTLAVVSGRRGGIFKYDPTYSAENNGGTIFNGWVRQYSGAIYLEWFCETDTATTDCSPYLTKALTAGIVINAGTGTFLFKTQVGLGGLGVPNYDGTVQYNWGDTVLKIIGTGQTTFLIDTEATGKPVFTSAKQLINPDSQDDIFTGKIEVTGINFVGVNKDLTVPEHWEMVEGSKNIHDKVFDLDRIYNMYVHHCNFTWLGYVFEVVKPITPFNYAYSQSTTIKDNHFFHCNRIVYSSGNLINFTFKDNMCEKNYGGIYTKDTSTCRINDNLFEGGGQFIDITGDAVATTINGNYIEYNIQADVLINKCQIRIAGNPQGTTINGNSFIGFQSSVLQYDPDYCDIKLSKPVSAYSEQPLNEVDKPIISGNFTESRQLHTSGAAISTANRSPFWITVGYEHLTSVSYINSAVAHPNHEKGYSFSSNEFKMPIAYSDYTQLTKPTSGYKLNAAITSSHPSGVPDGSIMIGIITLEDMLGDKGFNKVSSVAGRIVANVDFLSEGGVAVSHAAIQFDIAFFNAGKGVASKGDWIDDAFKVVAGKPSILQGDGMQISSNLPATSKTTAQFASPTTSSVYFLKTGIGRYAMFITGYSGLGASGVGTLHTISSSLVWHGNVHQLGIKEEYAANVGFIGYWW